MDPPPPTLPPSYGDQVTSSWCMNWYHFVPPPLPFFSHPILLYGNFFSQIRLRLPDRNLIQKLISDRRPSEERARRKWPSVNNKCGNKKKFKTTDASPLFPLPLSASSSPCLLLPLSYGWMGEEEERSSARGTRGTPKTN